MTAGSFNDSPLTFMDERSINLLEENFRDGEAEKAKIPPMAIQVCKKKNEMNTGMDVVRHTSAIIKQCAQN